MKRKALKFRGMNPELGFLSVALYIFFNHRVSSRHPMVFSWRKTMGYATIASIFTTGMDHWTTAPPEKQDELLKPQSGWGSTLRRAIDYGRERLSLDSSFSRDEEASESAKFTYNGKEITIDVNEACEVTPRQGWTAALSLWRTATDGAENDQFVRAVFHMGRGLGKAKSHFDAHKSHIIGWTCIALANLATWRRLSTAIVAVSAFSAFLRSKNDFTDGIKGHAWMQGNGQHLINAAAVIEDIAERVRILLNKDPHILGLVGGALLVHSAVYHALGSVSVISLFGFALMTMTSLATGHYIAADGLSNSQQAQPAEGVENEEKE
jgi:hypothetical protein